MGVKKLRFIYCVEKNSNNSTTKAPRRQGLIFGKEKSISWRLGVLVVKYIFLAFFSCVVVPAAWAQSPTFSPTSTSTPMPTFTPSPTSTFSPTFTPTFTPTSTNTQDPFATPTWTSTWGAALTDTPTLYLTRTPTNTYTPTCTGTITPPPTITPTMTSTPGISRSGLALLSTAYSDAWDRWDGFNWGMGFSYYIGSIVSRDFAKPNIDSLEPTRFALLSSDVKYAWLNDEGDMPGMASGLLLSFLAQLASGNSTTGASGTQSFQVAGNVMGGVYTVMSKTVAPNTAVHMGYIYGLKQADSHALGIISMNYSQLLPLLTTKLQNVTDDPPGVFYTGFNTRFWGRNWKFEVWKPIGMAENPVLFNSQIEGLPLAFNLGYEKWDQGWAVLGYVNIKFTIVPQPPAY